MDQNAESIWRNWETDGVPSSGNHDPEKPAIRRWGTWVEDGIENAFTSGSSILFSTKSALDADLDWPEITLAWVTNDPVAANNGIYQKQGASGTGSWTKKLDLPYSFIKATDAGAGTPDAIVATSSLPVPEADAGALIALNIFEDNAGSPVTVSFNGGSALTIKTNTGNDVAAGGLVAGMIIAGYKVGSTFRILTDQVSSAIVAAAEAAQAAAEAARDEAQGYAAALNFPPIAPGDGGKKLVIKLDETGVTYASDGFIIPVLDGSGDDTAAVQAAIDTGRNIDFGNGTYNVIGLNFNQANRIYKGAGAVLLFKGNTANRLANVNASGVTFDGVIFDGDLRQPRGGLVRVNDDCARPIFVNGAVRNMLGTEAGLEATNAMSGLSISPYGVTDIFVHNMDFENLRKSNDGTYYPITEGYGFVSGIDFGLEGGGDTSTPQGIPSGGIISGNRFDTIETILAVGSTNNDVATYDDAQAIRTVSNESGSYSLNLLIAGNTYRGCSKRALKIRHSGVVCVDNVVWADQSAFRMSAVFDIAHDSVLRNSTVYVTDEAKIPAAIAKIEAGLGQAATANRFAVIDGLEAEACVTLVEITGVFAGRPLENMTLRNVTCPRVSSYGLITTGNAPSTLRNNVVEGWRIQGLGDVARAINWAVTDGNGNCGLTVRDFEAINMDVAIIGHDADLDIRLKVASTTYAGTGSSALFRYSAPAFAAGSRPSVIRRVDIDALGISDAYLAARSLGLVYISAPRLVVEAFKMEVRDDLPTTTRHATIDGTDTSFKSIDYYGPGSLFIGVLALALRFEIDKATRRGGGATSASFLYFNNGANDLVAIHNVKDFRPSTGSTIDIVNGVAGTPYEIDGLRSRTTATNAVSGASLAVLNNVTKF
jgi:hypothetical protein